jgi:hypothetical protein
LIINTYNGSKSQALCSTHRGKRTCDGVWIDRVRLEEVVGVWLGGRVEEWANEAEAMRDVDNQRALVVKQLDGERADEDRIRDGLRAAQRLVTRGAMSEDDFIDRKREVDAELREIDIRISGLQAQLDALDPDGDVYDRLARALPEDMPTEEWNRLLKRIIRRIVVGPVEVTIDPYIGEPLKAKRSEFAPRRSRTDVQVRNAKGQYVKSS